MKPSKHASNTAKYTVGLFDSLQSSTETLDKIKNVYRLESEGYRHPSVREARTSVQRAAEWHDRTIEDYIEHGNRKRGIAHGMVMEVIADYDSAQENTTVPYCKMYSDMIRVASAYSDITTEMVDSIQVDGSQLPIEKSFLVDGYTITPTKREMKERLLHKGGLKASNGVGYDIMVDVFMDNFCRITGEKYAD